MPLLIQMRYDRNAYITLPDGEVITITLEAIKQNSATVGFNFPPTVEIDTHNVFHRKLDKELK